MEIILVIVALIWVIKSLWRIAKGLLGFLFDLAAVAIFVVIAAAVFL